MKRKKSKSFVQILARVTFLLVIGGCAVKSWGPFVAGQMAHQKGDYPTAVRHLEEALRVEPTSTIIQNTLNEVKNSWALEILRESDQIPSTDLNNKLPKVKKAAELAPKNPLVSQKLKELETLANNVRTKAAKLIALVDDGNYPEAQSILNDIEKYNLSEIEYSQKLLENSVDAHEKTTKLELKQPILLSSYRELSGIHKREPLGKKAKGLVAKKLEEARSQLIEGLLSKIESGKTLPTPKLSQKLAQFYKDALSASSGELPSIDAAIGRLDISPVPIGVYSKTPGTIIKRVRPALMGIDAGKEIINLVFLPTKPSKDDLNKLGLILILDKLYDKIVEKGRDNPQTKTSEYISSYQKVKNPQYDSVQADYQAALAKYNQTKLQSQAGTPTATLGGLLVGALIRGAAEAVSKQKLDHTTKLLQSTPQFTEEPIESSYEYQEYNLSLYGVFKVGYQLVDVKKRVKHDSEKFEWVKEKRWRERQNVHPEDIAGLQNSRRGPRFREKFSASFKKEADTNLSEVLLEKILSALRHRFEDSVEMGDMEEALEESIRYTAALYPQKKESDKEINDFIRANLLIAQLATGERHKVTDSPLDLSHIVVPHPDTIPPALTITRPIKGSKVRTKSVVVTGRASDNRKVVSITVNGRPAKMTKGKFTLDRFPLRLGDNSIIVKAKDEEGNQATRKVIVTRFVGGPPRNPNPLSLEDIADLLKNFVPPKRVVTLIEERGIKFEVTEDAKSRLVQAGANPLVLESLEKLFSSAK